MPKIVNHEQRKIEIAEATWKVIVKKGLESASVRNIAQASGISAGALRYYFPTQADLLLFSMELVSERVKERLEAKPLEGEPLEVISDLISEVLPIDEKRKIEAEVWFVFTAKALVDANLRALSNRVYEEMHEGFIRVIRMLQKIGLAKEHINIDLEANRLHALVDGMLMHHLLYPDHLTTRDLINTVQYHLRLLCKSG